jgi:hypothetical protein
LMDKIHHPKELRVSHSPQGALPSIPTRDRGWCLGTAWAASGSQGCHVQHLIFQDFKSWISWFPLRFVVSTSFFTFRIAKLGGPSWLAPSRWWWKIIPVHPCVLKGYLGWFWHRCVAILMGNISTCYGWCLVLIII